MIEVAQKDVLLNYLIDTVELGNVFLLPRRQELLGFTKGELLSLISHFHSLGLIHVDNLASNSAIYRIMVNVSAHDFRRRGGFAGHETLFQQNVEKLLWEVEKLERIDGPQKNTISEIRKKITEYLGILGNAATIGTSVKDALS